ncbi:hypothetical protein FSP39_017529 [Pinctada imbricata]|uniref:Uncharacterized protein n=1 Tax=Pinctada imbricata TaxID=66713 RepID=A0AA89C6Y1_PINIB|nr:hypothetical protein FSP39_017529 [Pinctada imbricata]
MKPPSKLKYVDHDRSYKREKLINKYVNTISISTMKPKLRDVENHENKKVYAILNKYLEEENLLEFQKTLLRFDKWDKQKVIRNVEVLYGSTVKRMVQRQNLSFLKYLIDTCSADINMPEDGMTPMWVAFNKGYIKFVIYLIGKGAKLQSLYNSRHILFEACKKRHLRLVEFILRQGNININMEDDNGYNCAYDLYVPKREVKGIKGKRKKMPPPSKFLSLLLKKGLDPNHINNRCEPLLKFVIDRRNLPSLKLLEKYGANLNETVPKIPAIVHAAMKANGRKVVDHLLESDHIYDEDKVYAANALALQVTGDEQLKYFLKAIEIRNKHWPDFDYANYKDSSEGCRILCTSKKSETTDGESSMEVCNTSVSEEKRSPKNSEESEENTAKIEDGERKVGKTVNEEMEGGVIRTEEDRNKGEGRELRSKSGGDSSCERKRKIGNEIEEVPVKKSCQMLEGDKKSVKEDKEEEIEVEEGDKMKKSEDTLREEEREEDLKEMRSNSVELDDSKISDMNENEDSKIGNSEDYSDEEDEVDPIFPNIMKETAEDMIKVAKNPLELKLYMVDIAAYIWDHVFKIDFGPVMRSIQKSISDQVRMGRKEFMLPLLKAFTIRYDHDMIAYIFHPALKEVTALIKENGCDEKVFEFSLKIMTLISKHTAYYDYKNFHFTPLWESNNDMWDYELKDSSPTLMIRLMQLISVLMHHKLHERPEFCRTLREIIKSSEKMKDKTMSLVHTAVLQTQDCGIELLKLLLRLGASPNDLDENGLPPVYYAVSVFSNDYNRRKVPFPLCKEIIDLLVEYGAHMDYCGKDGRNTLDLLANSGVDVCEVKYTTLQCLAARKLHDIPEECREAVPKHLEEFVSRHNPTSRDYVFMSDVLELLDLDWDTDGESENNDLDSSSEDSDDNNHYNDYDIDLPPYVDY